MKMSQPMAHLLPRLDTAACSGGRAARRVGDGLARPAPRLEARQEHRSRPSVAREPADLAMVVHAPARRARTSRFDSEGRQNFQEH